MDSFRLTKIQVSASVIFVAFLLLAASLRAHDDEKMVVEQTQKVDGIGATWGLINQLRSTLTSRIAERNLKSVHEISDPLSTAVQKLTAQSSALEPEQQRRIRGAVANLERSLDLLHEGADAGDQASVEKQMKIADALFKVLSGAYPNGVSSIVSLPVGDGEGHEGGGLMHTHGAHGAVDSNTVDASIITEGPFLSEQPLKATVRLKNKATGKPVTADDLITAHTKKVHLLIVDPSLSDYHHEHPIETSPGEWNFSFTPRAGGTYVIFADIHPSATDAQEYVRTTLDVSGTPRLAEQKETRQVTVDGYRFDLKVEGDGKIPAGSGAMVHVTVAKSDGSEASNLEPIMGAFAHGVGFTPDLWNVLHVHPLGEEPTEESQRGGPVLAFHVAPEKPGFYQFYVQVHIDGKDRFAGFGIIVQPKSATANVLSSTDHKQATNYVCPMHSSVVSTHPGESCPKCGMALIPKDT